MISTKISCNGLYKYCFLYVYFAYIFYTTFSHIKTIFTPVTVYLVLLVGILFV